MEVSYLDAYFVETPEFRNAGKRWEVSIHNVLVNYPRQKITIKEENVIKSDLLKE